MAMGWGIGQNHHPLVSMIFIKNYVITEFIFFIKNYGITEFYYFYQELRNYRIHFFIKNYGITEFYCLSADPLMDFSLIP